MFSIKSFLRNLIYIVTYFFHRNNKSKVVYYHDVTTDYTFEGNSPEIIKAHIKKFKELGYEFVTEITKPTGQIMVCFDDGWSGLYKYQNLFLDEGIYPTVFVAVSLIGSENHLTKEQLDEMVSKGFRLGAHSWSHVDLAVLSEEELIHELIDSKKELEQMFHMPFDYICFPMGRFSELVYRKCKEAGYSLFFSSLDGGYYDYYDKNLICRNYLQFVSPCVLKYYIKGFAPILFKRSCRQQYVNNA